MPIYFIENQRIMFIPVTNSLTDGTTLALIKVDTDVALHMVTQGGSN